LKEDADKAREIGASLQYTSGEEDRIEAVCTEHALAASRFIMIERSFTDINRKRRP